MPSAKEINGDIRRRIEELRTEVPQGSLRPSAYELKLRQMAEAEIRRRTVAEAEEKRRATREKNGTTRQRYDPSNGLRTFADRAYTPMYGDAERVRRTKRDPSFKGEYGLNTSEHRPGHDSRKRPKRRT